MSATENGGPAFPREDYQTDSAPGQQGMSLRDYFAAKAMQGVVAQALGTALMSDPAIAAVYAYRTADAMLEARNA